MEGIKVDHPPITFALVDPKTGHPTKAMVDFLHRLWLRTGGDDDNDQFIMQMLASGVPSARIPPSDERYQHEPPAPTTGHEALEAADLAKMLAITRQPAAFDISQVEKGKVPIGGIILWSGLVDDIPNNYALCDGANGTPDATNLFVRGATTDTDIGTTGGADSATVTTGSSTTGASVSTASQGATTGTDFNALTSANLSDPGHTHSATVDTVPRYYAFALIMRIN